MVSAQKKIAAVRRKQRLGAGWLLLPLVAGLPIAVFFAWKDQKPPVPPPLAHEVRNPGSDVAIVEATPGSNVGVVAPPEAAPAAPEVQSPVPPQGAPEESATTMPEPPKPEASAASAGAIPQPAAPTPPKIDWAEIATRPARWPAQTRTKTPVDFAIFVGGKRSGSIRIPAGTNVKVVKILEDGAEIAFAEYSAKVALDQTTLGEQIGNPSSESRPETRVAERPTPASKVEAAAPPKSETALVPQQNWRSSSGDGRAHLIELLKVLEHQTEADSSLEMTEHPEIYRGVTLMMPLRKALAQLGVSADLLPSRIPVAHPGIPLYVRTFPCKYSLVGEPDDYYNTLNILTDADDRVVGIEYVCESPRSRMYYPKEEFQTYNFLLDRQKASTSLKVGCEVTPFSNDVLRIESWVFDDRQKKCLEIVRLYLPNRIANFLRHVIETRLGKAG